MRLAKKSTKNVTCRTFLQLDRTYNLITRSSGKLLRAKPLDRPNLNVFTKKDLTAACLVVIAERSAIYFSKDILVCYEGYCPFEVSIGS
jgi:hypothetical protein